MAADVNKFLITFLLLFLFQCRVLGNAKENRGTITLSELRNIVNLNKDAGGSEYYAKQFKKRAITTDEGKNKLDKVDDQGKIEKVNKLDEVEDQGKVEKVKKLDKVDDQGKVEKVKKLDNMKDKGKVKKVKNIDKAKDQGKVEKVNKLDKVEEQGKVEKVKMLDKAEDQGKVEKVETLNKVEDQGKVEEVKNIDKVEDQGKVEKIKKLDKVIDKGKVKNVKKLDKVEDQGKVEKVKKLDKAEDQGKVEKVKKLDKGEDQGKVEKVKTLNKVEDQGKVEKVKTLNKVEDQGKVEKVKKLDKVEDRGKVEKVKRLDKVEDQGKVEKVKTLDKVEDRGKVEKVKKLDKVKHQGNVEKVKNIDKVKDQGQVEKVKKVKDQGKVEKVKNLDKAEVQVENKKSRNGEVKKIDNVEDQRENKKVANVENIINKKEKLQSTLLQPIFIPYSIEKQENIVVDPCIPNPCINGGICKRASKALKSAFHCTCPIEFRGTFCQELMKRCDQIGCRHISECIRSPLGAVCTCSEGNIDKLCKLDVEKPSSWEKISMVVSKTTRYEVVILLAVVCSLIIITAIIMIIHCCRVNSKRSVLCKYYKKAQKKGIFLPPPPDWCDISNDLINRALFCCKARGPSVVEKYISKSLSKTEIQLKEDKRQSQMALIDKFNQGDPSLYHLIDSEINRRNSSFKYIPIKQGNSIRELPAYHSLGEKMVPADKWLSYTRRRFSVNEQRRNSLQDIDQDQRRASVSDMKSMYERSLARRKLSVISTKGGFIQEHQRSHSQPLADKRKSSLISSNISSPMENIDNVNFENIDESKTTKTTDPEGNDVNEADEHSVPSKILSEILQRRTSLRPVKLSSSRLRKDLNLSSNASLREESRNMNQIWDNLLEQNTDNKQRFKSRESVGKRVDVIKRNLKILKNKISKKTPLLRRVDGNRVKQNNPRHRRTRSEERYLMTFPITEDGMPEYAKQITVKRSKPRKITQSIPKTKEHIAHYSQVNTNTNTNDNLSSVKSSTYFDSIRFYETQIKDLMHNDNLYPEKNTANNCNVDRSYNTPNYGCLIDPSLERDNLETTQWYWSKDPLLKNRSNSKEVEQLISETEKDWQANEPVTVRENNANKYVVSENEQMLHPEDAKYRYVRENNVNKYVVSENEQMLQPEDPEYRHVRENNVNKYVVFENEQMLQPEDSKYRHSPDYRLGFQEETKSKGKTYGSKCFGIWSTTVQVPLSGTELKKKTEFPMGAESNNQFKTVSSCKENEISAADVKRTDSQGDDLSLDRMYLRSFQKDGQKLYCIRCDHFDRNAADVQSVERTADNIYVFSNEVIGQGVDLGSPSQSIAYQN